MLMIYPSQCLGKLRRNPEDETKIPTCHQHQRKAQKITRSALAKLLPEVQVCVCANGRLFVCFVEMFHREVVAQHSVCLCGRL